MHRNPYIQGIKPVVLIGKFVGFQKFKKESNDYRFQVFAKK